MIDYNLGEKYFDKFVSLSQDTENEFFDEFSHFGKDDVWEGPMRTNDLYSKLYSTINWAKEAEKDNSTDTSSDDVLPENT